MVTVRHAARAIYLVWEVSRSLAITLSLLTVVTGALPAGVAYAASLIVDAIVACINGNGSVRLVIGLVALEAAIVVVFTGTQRWSLACKALLHPLLSQRVNTMILEKAMTFELEHFEDSELYDRLSRARRESASRPLSLTAHTAALAQNVIALVSFGSLLVHWSLWAVLVLLLAGVPAFIVETRFSDTAFRLNRKRSEDFRRQKYLETVLTRDDFAKEVKFFDLGNRFMNQHRDIFRQFYREYYVLTVKRHAWGLVFALLATFAFYGVYCWIALAAVAGSITLGEMTMYLMVFRQGQGKVSSTLLAIGGMYEDALQLSTLYEVFDAPVRRSPDGMTCGPQPEDGLRLEGVSFTYPGAHEPALQSVSLHLAPGKSLSIIGENGSGKTTLIKLITRLYRPTSGRILLQGLDLEAWDADALRRTMSAVFQDFTRYQMQLGENIGAGDHRHFDDERRWRNAAALGRAWHIAERFTNGYYTQLGKWFHGGHELSGGEWQRVAVSRSFMRTEANLFLFDEPTAMLDAKAEAQIYRTIRSRPGRCMVLLISHQLVVAQHTDETLILERGRIVERGSHRELLERCGRYASLRRSSSDGQEN